MSIIHKITPTVAVIIPAYNEEARIGAVLQAVVATPEVAEVIVVCDGSTDRTAQVASQHNVRVEQLAVNRGKGGAMLCGARLAEGADVVLFLDADLIGLNSSHVSALIAPVASGKVKMAVGQFVGGRGLTDLAQVLVKCISGQRAIDRNLFLSIPGVDTVGYGIEMLITFHVSSKNLDTDVVVLRGVTHPMKEEKLGFLRGAAARTHMYAQMGRFWASYHFRGRPPKGVLDGTRLVQSFDKRNEIVGNGSGQDNTVDPVQNATVTR